MAIILGYTIRAEHSRKMVQAAMAYLPDLETSIACKLGEEKQRAAPYPSLSVEQARMDVDHYRALAELHRELVKRYEKAALHPREPAPWSRRDPGSRVGGGGRCDSLA